MATRIGRRERSRRGPGGAPPRPAGPRRVVAAACALAYVALAPPSPISPPPLPQLAVLPVGFTVWDNDWYGGHHLPGVFDSRLPSGRCSARGSCSDCRWCRRGVLRALAAQACPGPPPGGRVVVCARARRRGARRPGAVHPRTRPRGSARCSPSPGGARPRRSLSPCSPGRASPVAGAFLALAAISRGDRRSARGGRPPAARQG